MLRPYSRYPGYTTGRFGRVRSPGKSSQAMTPFQKVSGELRVLGHSDQYRLDEKRPLIPRPPARWYQSLRYVFLGRTGPCGSGDQADLVESTGKAVQCLSRGFLNQVILRLIAPLVRKVPATRPLATPPPSRARSSLARAVLVRQQ